MAPIALAGVGVEINPAPSADHKIRSFGNGSLGTRQFELQDKDRRSPPT